jgi:type IV secretory pathway VirJ component
MKRPMIVASLLALAMLAGGQPAVACGGRVDGTAAASIDSAGLHDLPLVEVPAARSGGRALALILTGDGGWAEIDQRIARALANAGVAVVGLDSRAYLTAKRRSADGTASDVTRVLVHYLSAWHRDSVVLVGYSRGADLLPFVANRLPGGVRDRVSLLALLGLSTTANFEFHWSDLVHAAERSTDIPILPELERLRGTKVMCLYGRGEADSLCRTAPPGIVEAFAREGKHHFDGDYEGIARDILARM